MSLLDEAIADVNKTPGINFDGSIYAAMKERQLHPLTPHQIQTWLESFMQKPCGITSAVSVCRCEEIGLDMGELTYAGLSADGNPVVFFGDRYLESVQKVMQTDG